MSFGHMGDGNMHFNVSQPPGMDKKKYLDGWNEMNKVVFDVVLKFGGSISAEHGIGRLKKHHMPEIKSPVELQMMRDLKKLFDPRNIMNPAKSCRDDNFRELKDVDVDSIVTLWKRCELTRNWNDPYKDIQFAREGKTSTVLVGLVEGRVVASVMVGHDGHRGVLYYLAVDPAISKKRLWKGCRCRRRGVAARARRVENKSHGAQ